MNALEFHYYPFAYQLTTILQSHSNIVYVRCLRRGMSDLSRPVWVSKAPIGLPTRDIFGDCHVVTMPGSSGTSQTS